MEESEHHRFSSPSRTVVLFSVHDAVERFGVNIKVAAVIAPTDLSSTDPRMLQRPPKGSWDIGQDALLKVYLKYTAFQVVLDNLSARESIERK